MIASFMTKWPKEMPKHMAGQPTYFVNKISHTIKDVLKDHIPLHFCPEGYDALKTTEVNPKYHTIRIDEKDRWKAGTDIHFYINARTKNMFQFAPVIPCVSTQKIEVMHMPGYARVKIDDNFFGEIYHHGLDDIYEYTNCLMALAINDGFDSLEDFFAYFSKNFIGKIIHWTPLRYY